MTNKVLADQFGADEGIGLWLRRFAMIVLGVALLWLSAKVKVMTEPVPVTLQTFAIMAIAMAYGARMGVAVMLADLALGAMGEPVFANTPERCLGLPYMFGPTGGYLAGFLIATLSVGLLSDRGWDRSVWTAAPAMAVGLAALYLLGILWLAYGFPIVIMGANFSRFDVSKAIEFGLAPFILADIAKVALAAITFPIIWKLLGR
jgi:biotin transport system substrate-specific component